MLLSGRSLSMSVLVLNASLQVHVCTDLPHLQVMSLFGLLTLHVRAAAERLVVANYLRFDSPYLQV